MMRLFLVRVHVIEPYWFIVKADSEMECRNIVEEDEEIKERGYKYRITEIEFYFKPNGILLREDY